MPFLPEEKQKAIASFKSFVDSLPANKKSMPFIHVLGTSLTPDQMLAEMEAGTAIGQAQIRAELRKLGYTPTL